MCKNERGDKHAPEHAVEYAGMIVRVHVVDRPPECPNDSMVCAPRPRAVMRPHMERYVRRDVRN